MTHTQLAMGIEATRVFFNEEGGRAAETIVKEIQDINKSVQAIPGFKGSFGLGYPFYAMNDLSDSVEEVPAINDFIEQSQSLVRQSRDFAGEVWPCAGCQETRHLPDLKSQCKPCNDVLFKPRDLFKALPDIDVVNVFDAPTCETELQLQDVLQKMNLLQSDSDIRGTYLRTMGTLQQNNPSKLPIDAHIWSLASFEACCGALRENPAYVENQIISRSLHTRWEDNQINFWFDFIFSLTEIGEIDAVLKGTVDETRRTLVQSLGKDEIKRLVGRVSARGKAILDDPKMEQIFDERISSWQNL